MLPMDHRPTKNLNLVLVRIPRGFSKVKDLPEFDAKNKPIRVNFIFKPVIVCKTGIMVCSEIVRL